MTRTPGSSWIAAVAAHHGALLCGTLAFLLRLAWVLAVPTRPVGDFAMYIESANYLITWGHLDSGFIYMPGYVLLVALLEALGGELLAIKMVGVLAGALGAAAAFGIARHLLQDHRAAWLSGIAAALWPAGVMLSSVAGTDMPAAALIAAAVWALVAWGPTRPRRAAIGFGLLMGLAAYIRAVAFPLCALSAVYWVALRIRRPEAQLPATPLSQAASTRRPSWMDVGARTALAVVMALLVVTPWAVRNRIRNGDLRFTDYHGGITALIGANPNSEGTYTRALNELFTRTTGRWVLDEPHGPVDSEALAMAREWSRWEPGYTAGLLIKKAEQLFDGEYRLLYWPIDGPGVLREPHRSWFGAHAPLLHAVANTWWAVLVALFSAGVAIALTRRQWLLLMLLPFQGALAFTYIVFFAEPRYRLPIELLALPVAASAVAWLIELPRSLVRSRRASTRATAGPLVAALAAVALVAAGWPRLLSLGHHLRRVHGWGTSVCSVAGAPRVCKWRRAGTADAGASPVHGAPDAVGLTLDGGRMAQAAMEVGGAPLPAGRYRLRARLSWPEGGDSAQASLQLPDGTTAQARRPQPAGTASTLEVPWLHAGGPVRLTATASAGAGARGSLWLQDLTVDPG